MPIKNIYCLGVRLLLNISRCIFQPSLVFFQITITLPSSNFFMVKIIQFIIAFFCHKVVPISVNMLDDKLAMHFWPVFEEVQDIVPAANGRCIGR